MLVVGWTDPEGIRPLSAHYCSGTTTPDGQLIYAGRVGPACGPIELPTCCGACSRCEIDRMPLDVASPRSTRFGSPLVLSRVHWVRPELVVEVKYLTWTEDSLLRQVVYKGEREDKQAREVVRS